MLILCHTVGGRGVTVGCLEVSLALSLSYENELSLQLYQWLPGREQRDPCKELLCCLVSIVNVTEFRVTWEEVTSVEELP